MPKPRAKEDKEGPEEGSKGTGREGADGNLYTRFYFSRGAAIRPTVR